MKLDNLFRDIIRLRDNFKSSSHSIDLFVRSGIETINKMNSLDIFKYKNVHFLWVLIQQNSQFSDSVNQLEFIMLNSSERISC